MANIIPPVWEPFADNPKENPQFNLRLSPDLGAKLIALADECRVSPALMARVIVSQVLSGQEVSTITIKGDTRRR